MTAALFFFFFQPASQPRIFAAGIAMYQRIDLAPIAAGSAPAVQFTAVTLDGTTTPINLTGKLVRFLAYSQSQPAGDCDPFDAILQALFQYDTNAGGVAISGDNSNLVTVTFAQANTTTPGPLRYWILNVTDRLPLFRGKLPIRPAVWSV